MKFKSCTHIDLRNDAEIPYCAECEFEMAQQGEPAVICGYCAAEDDKCIHCKGVGFVSKYVVCDTCFVHHVPHDFTMTCDMCDKLGPEYVIDLIV